MRAFACTWLGEFGAFLLLRTRTNCGSLVPLLTYPDNEKFLRTAYSTYRKYNQYTQAVALAIRLNDRDLIEEAFNSTKDKSIRRQMAFLIARQRIWFDVSDDDDPELQECMNNSRLPDHFKALGKELNILDPKTPDDIYSRPYQHRLGKAQPGISHRQCLCQHRLRQRQAHAELGQQEQLGLEDQGGGHAVNHSFSGYADAVGCRDWS
jgi:hypothetical protein